MTFHVRYLDAFATEGARGQYFFARSQQIPEAKKARTRQERVKEQEEGKGREMGAKRKKEAWCNTVHTSRNPLGL